MSAITVDVINDYTTFERLAPQWNETVERAGLTHPFLRHEWLRTWWDSFGQDRLLNVMVVRAGRKIIALAPLMLETAKMYGITVRRVQFLHNDHTPKADVIVTERADEAFDALWASLMKARSHWDVLQLSQLPGDSPTHGQIGRLAACGDYATTLWQSDVSPYLELTSDWNAYLQGRNAKLRQNLRNRLNRLSQQGEVSLQVIGDRAAVQHARDHALSLESSGWKRQAGTAICSDPNVLRFYTLLADRAAEQGWLRLVFLTVGGKRIATSYASRYRDRLSFFKTGYDPEYAKYAPFKLLTYFAIKDGFSAGLREVDFLGDAEPWKLEWTTTTRPHDWLFVFGHTARAWLAYTAKCRVIPAAKRLLHAARPHTGHEDAAAADRRPAALHIAGSH
ncbi:MAG TPA: GNAT family N-acetyltransferase [Vicinamibacterales bacterium]|nr:GNAT family N-acetyltransferase [Vicinamibacterales bacterium]